METHTPPREVTLRPKALPPALLQAAMVAKQVLPRGDGHVTLYEDKIHVQDTTGDSEALPRRYTVTHNDRTAEIFLSVGPEYDREALSQPHTREKQDEVLAELTGESAGTAVSEVGQTGPRLTVTCRVDGDELTGRTAEPAARRRIFENEMPFVLAVIRYGDRFFFERHPEWDRAEVSVEFQSADPRLNARREFGRITDYRVTRIAGESRRLMVGAAAIAAVGIGALVYGKLKK